MKTVDETLWENWDGALKEKFAIAGFTRTDQVATFTVRGDDGTDWNLPVRPTSVHVVGIDIVGYSKRSSEGQLLLTSFLFNRIDSTIKMLRKIGWLATTQPPVSIPLGDGAMLVFDGVSSVQFALGFIFCLNMWIEDLNRHHLYSATTQEFESAQPHPVLPLHCRFVLNGGEVIYIKDVNKNDNAIGPALVTNARILAASKGAHFLVDALVMNELNTLGGIDGIQTIGAPVNWTQSLYTALMPETKVKSAPLKFYNVFGKYGNAPLLKVLNSPAVGSATYNVGSHDVTSISA